MHHLFNIKVDFYTTATRLSAWFDNPLVLCVSQAELFFTDQSLKLIEHIFYLIFESCWLNISKPALKWSVEWCTIQVNVMIWLTEKVIHLVSDSVELGRRKLCIRLHLNKESSRHDIDASLSYRYTNNHLLKVCLRKLYRWLLNSFQERNYECKFEILAKVFEFFTLRITYVKTLGEDTTDVPVMFPYKILHIVSQAYLSSDRILSKDMIDLWLQSF